MMRRNLPTGDLIFDHRRALFVPDHRALVVAIDPGCLAQQVLFEPERTLSDRLREITEEVLAERVIVIAVGSWGSVDLRPFSKEVMVVCESEDIESTHPKLHRLELGDWAIEAIPGLNLSKPELAPGGHRTSSGAPAFVLSGFTTWMPLFEGPNETPLPEAPKLEVLVCGEDSVFPWVPEPQLP